MVRGKHGWIRILFLILLVIAYLALSWVRHSYIINLKSPTLLEQRGKPDIQRYPLEGEALSESISSDSRWSSTILYGLLLMAVTIGIIYLVFLDIRYVKVGLALYGLTAIIILLFLGISFITKSYTYGYKIAQIFKNLLQEPFFPFFIIALLVIVKKMQLFSGEKQVK